MNRLTLSPSSAFVPSFGATASERSEDGEEWSNAGRVRNRLLLLGGVRGGFKGSMPELLFRKILAPTAPPCSCPVAAGEESAGVRGHSHCVGFRHSFRCAIYTCNFARVPQFQSLNARCQETYTQSSSCHAPFQTDDTQSRSWNTSTSADDAH